MKTYLTSKEINDLMGNTVEVTKILVRQKRSGVVKWKTEDVFLVGMIVGHRLKRNGRIDYGDYNYYEANTFVMSDSVPCLLVSCNPRNNPIPVPYDGYVLFNP